MAIDIAAREAAARPASWLSAPALVLGDALRLPFPDASFDRVMSICAIEHFDDGPHALSEMARVLAPGGELVMSADTLSRAAQWPELYRAHCERYHVQRTYTHEQLTGLLAERGPGRPRVRLPVPFALVRAAVPDPVRARRPGRLQRRRAAGPAGRRGRPGHARETGARSCWCARGAAVGRPGRRPGTAATEAAAT